MNKFNFTTQDISWTVAMEEFAKETIEKGTSRITSEDVSYVIKISVVDKKTKLIKVELSGNGFRAQCANKDFYSAMTAVVSKYKSLVIKHSKKTISKKHKSVAVEQEIIPELVSKEKIFVLTPSSVEDAIKAFEQTDYPFYVFKNAESCNDTSVLYRRADDSIGMIICR